MPSSCPIPHSHAGSVEHIGGINVNINDEINGPTSDRKSAFALESNAASNGTIFAFQGPLSDNVSSCCPVPGVH